MRLGRWRVGAGMVLLAVACDGKKTAPPAADAAVVQCATTDAGTTASAEALAVGTRSDVAICAKEFFFASDFVAGDVVTLTLAFSNVAGDIDVALIDPEGSIIATSAGTGDGEQLSAIPARLTGRYFVRLYNKNRYTLRTAFSITLAVTHDSSCTDDALEPNDTVVAARAVGDGGGAWSGLVLCASNKDHFRVDLDAGDVVTATLAADAGLALSLYVVDSAAPTTPFVVARAPTVAYGPVAFGGPVYLMVSADAGVTGAYDLGVSWVRADGGRPVRLSGVVTYERQLVTATGYVNQGYVPAAFARVDAVSAATGKALAEVATNDAGAFEFPELLVFGDAGLQIRALAQRFEPTVNFSVRDNPASNAIVAATSAVYDETAVGPSISVSLAVSEMSGAGGAFHLLSLASRAEEFVRAATGKSISPLTLYWTKGTNAYGCGTCYVDSVVYVGGTPSDPDEYDDAVVLHEIGHHVVRVLSRDDSIGGDHNGSKTDPVLAFSEGWATFFALAVRGDPVYYDYRTADVLAANFETMAEAASFGTGSGALAGDVSEWLVSAFLWDVLDAPADTGDGLNVGFGVLFDPLAKYFTAQSFADRGAVGRDFVDYLDGWSCRALGSTSELTALISARQFPYDFAGPTSCPE
ncbi:MAG: hypothetical protein HYY84_13600 [Deltaproteobacteria bacterium]|nr:hypothetical protein [Deltaproteobacteria bacterium]